MTSKQQDKAAPPNDRGGRSGQGPTTQPHLLPDFATSIAIPSIVVYEPDARPPSFAPPPRPLRPESTYAALALDFMDTRFPSQSQQPRPGPEASSPQQQQGEEPWPKRQRLEEGSSSWIDQALQRGRLERSRSGRPDPFPFPEGHEPTSTSRPSLGSSSGFPVAPDTGHHHLSPHSRRSSSCVTSATDLRGSPAPSYEYTPRDSPAGISGLSELDVASREEGFNSQAPGSAPEPDYGDTNATFECVYEVEAPVTLAPRQTVLTSMLEQLPTDIFMRILMHCGYEDQIWLKRCSFKLFHLVDLDAIPWAKRTATILEKERYNPKNFPQKASKVRKNSREPTSRNDGEDGNGPDGKGESSTRSKTKRNRPHPLGKWGCYTCYNILPPHYFEGPLLEDAGEEGRTAKYQRKRGSDTVESTDKKVDMRVEYIQVLGVVPAKPPPEWLRDVDRRVHHVAAPSSVLTYVQQRGAKGVVCRDDLREYYRDIYKETYLVAPLRGVTPVFVELEARHGVPRFDLDVSMLNYSRDAINRLKHPIAPNPNAASFSSVSTAGATPPGGETTTTYRTLYYNGSNRAPQARGDTEGGHHFYELFIPHGAKRDKDYLPRLLGSQPAGRIILPMQKGPESCQDDEEAILERPVVQVDDGMALRRICIPCGTKYGVYRRDCNRKIVSKTGKGWWVCACPQVRETGRCRGCPECGKRTIY